MNGLTIGAGLGTTIVARLQSLADATRNRLLLLLEEHELTVGELCAALHVPQSTASRHLKVLADEGWVDSRAEGTSRLYRMTARDLDPAARRLWAVVREEVAAIRAWGAGLVVTLAETAELEALGVPDLGARVRAAGLAWLHLPVRDYGVPDAAFEAAWTTGGAAIRTRLLAGRDVMLHCRGGLGRSGMIAARLLVELGMEAGAAIAAVRAARPGAIETAAQEAHVRAVPRAIPGP